MTFTNWTLAIGTEDDQKYMRPLFEFLLLQFVEIFGETVLGAEQCIAQPFGFQRQTRIAQVMVGHHRVVAGFLNAKYRHVITSLRRFGKVFILGEKTASMPPGYPGEKTYGRRPFG